jgi:hypothetical protein
MITIDYHLSISNLFDGRCKSFIYFIYSKSHRVCYVGQTANDLGPIARLVQHFKGEEKDNREKGTFNKQLYNATGKSLFMINDLEFYFHLLPDERIFFSSETTYRNAVEYMVQSKLLTLVALEPSPRSLPILNFISRVCPTSASNETKINLIADEIALNFVDNFNRN